MQPIPGFEEESDSGDAWPGPDIDIRRQAPQYSNALPSAFLISSTRNGRFSRKAVAAATASSTQKTPVWLSVKILVPHLLHFI